MSDFAFHHCAISVPDLAAAIVWYHRMFGLEEQFRFTIAEIGAEVAMIGSGDIRVEIFALDKANPLPPDRRDPRRDIATHGTKHMALAVPDLDAALARLKTLGADIAAVPPPGPQKIAFIRDCAGNLIELVET